MRELVGVAFEENLSLHVGKAELTNDVLTRNLEKSGARLSDSIYTGNLPYGQFYTDDGATTAVLDHEELTLSTYDAIEDNLYAEYLEQSALNKAKRRNDMAHTAEHRNHVGLPPRHRPRRIVPGNFNGGNQMVVSNRGTRQMATVLSNEVDKASKKRRLEV